MRRPRPRHLYRLATDPSARRRWIRERWLDSASRQGVHALGIYDVSGRRYFIDPRDRVIGRSLFLEGSYEQQTLDRAIALIDFTPEQICDIGANIGTVTVELLTRFPNALAVAFEPDDRNCRLLMQNLLSNGLLHRTHVVSVALSDTDGWVEFETSADNLGDHRVRVSNTTGAFGEEQRATRTVQSRRLESLMRDGEVILANHTLVSLDAQGHEGHILDGGPALMHHPIIVEFWPYGLRRAGGYDRFLSAIKGRTIVNLVETPMEVTVDMLRGMELGTGLTDLLVLP